MIHMCSCVIFFSSVTLQLSTSAATRIDTRDLISLHSWHGRRRRCYHSQEVTGGGGVVGMGGAWEAVWMGWFRINGTIDGLINGGMDDE